MLLRKLSLLVFLFTLSLGSFAQGIEFFHGSWEEALVKAEVEGKLIFVDAYTTWCGPCKQMSANVFPQPEVGEVFNANFINVKLDMEKPESESFRRVHPVRAYPTLFWINGKDEVVHQSVGGKQVGTLLTTANAAIAKQDDLPVLQAAWDEGNREPAFAFKYIRALVRQGENHLRPANDYLRDQQDLTTEANLQIIQVAATDADSRIFELLLQNKAGIVALNGAEAFELTVKNAVSATKAKALEYKDASLLETAVKKLAVVDAAGAKQLELQGAFELAAAGTDEKAFTKAMKNYLKKGVAEDPTRLWEVNQVATTSKFIEDDDVLEMAVTAGSSAAAADVATGYRQYYRIADFLLKQRKADMALTYAKKALETLPEKQANYERAIQGLIKRIEAAR